MIEKVEDRVTPQGYNYTDIHVKENESELVIKYSIPTSTSSAGKLVKLLSEFTEVTAGKEVDPEKILRGYKVVFMTMKQTTDKGTFCNIVHGSLKPKDKKISD